GQAVDLELEDRIGLFGVELEARHDFFGGVRFSVRLPDHLDDLVERVEDGFESFEDVNALSQRCELVLEPLRHDFEPEVQEVPEDLFQIQAFGPADFGILGRDQARQVDGEVDQQRQFALQHDLADALDELRFIDRVRNAVDVNGFRRARFRTDVPRAAQPD